MAHVFVLQGGERLHSPLPQVLSRHRALLAATALTVSGALFGSLALAHDRAPSPASPCVHTVGALGPYGVANGSGTTVSDPGCTAVP